MNHVTRSIPTLVAADREALPLAVDSAVGIRGSEAPEDRAPAEGAPLDALGLAMQHTSPDSGVLVPETGAVRLPKPGERIGRYLIEEILGRGGMGLVLRARDDLLQREVAVKVMLPQYSSSDPTAGLRFLREAEIVARLDHPHIISVLDAGLHDGIAFLVFAYVRGPSFAQLRSRGALPLERAVELLLPVVSAVAHAHRGGVVHGDLKPTNLILGEDYLGRPHPWVLDFGVSFFTEVDSGLDPTHGRISGTPGYLAPEWLERDAVDGRADCFSLGCVLYELVVGHGPFAGCRRISEALEKARGRDYDPVSSSVPVAPAFEEIIRRALEADPDARYPSADALGRALLEFAAPEVRALYEEEFTRGPRFPESRTRAPLGQ